MKGAAIQEFNNVLFVDELYPQDAFNGTPEGFGKNVAYWESPRLSTEFPLDGNPAGADRGICRIVNGLVAVNFIDKQLLDLPKDLAVSGALYGEYAGISGVIDQITFSQEYTPLITQMYASSGALAFPQLSSFANLAQNIFIRVVFARENRSYSRRPPLPLKVSITGTLLALGPK